MMDARTVFVGRTVLVGALVLLASLAVAGCKSKAQKQAELAAADLPRLEKVIADRHLDSLARALPASAAALSAKIAAGTDVKSEGTKLGEAFVELRNKTDDLRSAKRSYYVITDAGGEVVFVDEPSWGVVGRRLGVGFPAVRDALEGRVPFARGFGRYGGASEEALTLIDVAPIRDSGARVVGSLAAAWEAHEAAEDLQRQLVVELSMRAAEPKKRIRERDRLKMAMDQPEVWVAVFRGGFVYFQDEVPQPIEEAAKALELAKKTAGGTWVGTFDVTRQSWGGAAKRLDALGTDVGVAVLRHEP